MYKFPLSRNGFFIRKVGIFFYGALNNFGLVTLLFCYLNITLPMAYHNLSFNPPLAEFNARYNIFDCLQRLLLTVTKGYKTL